MVSLAEPEKLPRLGEMDTFAQGHTFDNFMGLAFLLDDLLGRRVELVTPESLSPHIGPHILREVKHVLVAA